MVGREKITVLQNSPPRHASLIINQIDMEKI
jgi:hypothetical protein